MTTLAGMSNDYKDVRARHMERQTILQRKDRKSKYDPNYYGKILKSGGKGWHSRSGRIESPGRNYGTHEKGHGVSLVPPDFHPSKMTRAAKLGEGDSEDTWTAEEWVEFFRQYEVSKIEHPGWGGEELLSIAKPARPRKNRAAPATLPSQLRRVPETDEDRSDILSYTTGTDFDLEFDFACGFDSTSECGSYAHVNVDESGSDSEVLDDDTNSEWIDLYECEEGKPEAPRPSYAQVAKLEVT